MSPISRVPVIASVVAVRSPPEVPPAASVNVEYVAAGMVLLAVKVKFPEEAFGMLTAPEPTVIRPELFRVVFTVSTLLPMARVPEVRVIVPAVTAPCAVPPAASVNVP